jgi:hypothetical protein
MRRKAFTRTAAAVGATAALVGVTMAQPASAQSLELDMTADVTTHVAGMVDTTVEIPTGSLTGSVDLGTGELDTSLDLPAATFSYNAVGFLPMTITFEVQEVEPGVTGTVDLDTMTMEVESNFDVVLTSVSAFGFFELLDPDETCKTTTPSNAPMSGTLELAEGITAELEGEYEIAPLEGCGFMGGIISGFTAGPGNTLEVTAQQDTL